jgi:hypothetical protein
MYPATAWDDAEFARVRGWTVMGRLREHQQTRSRAAEDARRRLAARPQPGEPVYHQVSLARQQQEYEDSIRARWRGGPTVLAFLFAHPDSDAVQMLDTRGDYFDCRTGDTWDLFFPGYYKSTRGQGYEVEAGARPVGRDFTRDWYFDPEGFNALRGHVERSSDRRWVYSGGTDLVLVNGYFVEGGAPTIDWISTISGQVTDSAIGIKTLALSEVIERMTRDLETAMEDPAYGVGALTGEPPAEQHTATRDFVINALAAIAAELAKRAMGM